MKKRLKKRSVRVVHGHFEDVFHLRLAVNGSLERSLMCVHLMGQPLK
jgi:hypothetical protein